MWAGPDQDAIWDRAARLGASFISHGPSVHYPDIEPIVARHPDVPIALDHNGGAPRIERPSVPRHDDLSSNLAKYPNVYVKLIPHKEEEPFPYKDSHDAFKRLYDAFGPQRLMWGTNFPGVERETKYAPALEVFQDHVDWLTEEDKRMDPRQDRHGHLQLQRGVTTAAPVIPLKITPGQSPLLPFSSLVVSVTTDMNDWYESERQNPLSSFPRRAGIHLWSLPQTECRQRTPSPLSLLVVQAAILHERLLPVTSPDLTNKNACTILSIGDCPRPALATTRKWRKMAQNGTYKTKKKPEGAWTCASPS